MSYWCELVPPDMFLKHPSCHGFKMVSWKNEIITGEPPKKQQTSYGVGKKRLLIFPPPQALNYYRPLKWNGRNFKYNQNFHVSSGIVGFCLPCLRWVRKIENRCMCASNCSIRGHTYTSLTYFSNLLSLIFPLDHWDNLLVYFCGMFLPT